MHLNYKPSPMISKLISLILVVLFLSACQENLVQVSGELKQWHTIELTFNGPVTSENAKENPFLDYRLVVTFNHDSKTFQVPGFYAADGNASETSADQGNQWQVRFCPDLIGVWNYSVSFKKGKDIAIHDEFNEGESISFDGLKGSFKILKSDKKVPDFRALGRIEAEGHYLKYAGSDTYFLKGGADSPENFLAFADFDQTYRYGQKAVIREGEANPKENIHQYAAHMKDWQDGDPVWQNGKGKGIIGALNYLASKGVNSVYMLTLNIQGDGKDVWPYSDHNDRYRFDCSKLDQWEIVFKHMEKLGMMMHFVLQETENECLLDAGHTQVQRKLYLRELVARFGHHLGITWNIGEENGPADWTPVGQTDSMRKEMASYLKSINPYSNFVVIHTHSKEEGQDRILTPLLGFDSLDGISLQNSDVKTINQRISHFRSLSSDSGKPWVICLDEIGPAWKGVMPDEFDAAHDTVRQHALWGSLMGGAAGVEWYFGYRFPNNDLNCEDFRSRSVWWDQTKIALDFFRQNLPLDQMHAANELVNIEGAFCLAKPGEVYIVYLPIRSDKRTIKLTVVEGQYSIQWYNPRSGGLLQNGTATELEGTGPVDIGLPPVDPDMDWVALIRKVKDEKM